MKYSKTSNFVTTEYNNLNLINDLLNHFFTCNNNVYIKKEKEIIGFINIDSFLSNINNIDKMIQPITKLLDTDTINEDEIEDKQFIVVDSNKNILYEYKLIEKESLSINEYRWDTLYKSNDKVINYLRFLNIKKVVIYGSLNEKVYNYIKVYGNKFEVELASPGISNFISYLNKDTLIIETDMSVIKTKEKLMESNNIITTNYTSNLMSLDEVCKNSEYYYFVNDFSKNKSIVVNVFDVPTLSDFKNLTLAEKQRIAFDRHYRYYYDRYKEDKKIASLLKKTLKELFSDEFILSRNYMPNVILKSARCFLENSTNEYCMSQNGLRRTTDQDYDYTFNLNIFGPCTVFGALVDDENTIPSFMQREINKSKYDYRVNNYGARAIDFVENIRTSDGILIMENDQFVYIISREEKEKLISFGYNNIHSLEPVFNNPNLKNYFIDEPVHCNHIANKQIAKYIKKVINKTLIKKDEKNKEYQKPLVIPKQKNVFKDNEFLKEYLSFLKTLEITKGKTGCILMNCNPFTLGHYNLIKYASNKVEKLFVIVVQEDKSKFKFQDRYEMVKLGCQEFNNVTVIPSGKIFASSMLFPEYFNKEDNPEVSVDLSLDAEIFIEHIAPTLNITIRFVGEENVDKVTKTYNEHLKRTLPLYGIEVEEIPRFKNKFGDEISAKSVREALKNKDYELLKELVPKTTLEILKRINEE